MAVRECGVAKEGGLSSPPRRRLRAVSDPPAAEAKPDADAAAPPKPSAAAAEDATSTAAERRTGRPRRIQAETAGAPVLTVVCGGKTLGVRPAEIVPADTEGWAEACRALRVLYRDFLAGGGLDVLRDRRSHARPGKDARERRAA